jgi:hypothetical protein
MGARNLRLVDMTMDVRYPFKETELPPTPPLEPIALLAVDNNDRARVWGWTASQIARGGGERPALEINHVSNPHAGLGHGVTRFRDGTIVVCTSGYSNVPNIETGYVYPPGSYTYGVQAPGSAPEFASVTSLTGLTGLRMCMELPNGNILIGRGTDFVMFTRAQFDARDWGSGVNSSGGRSFAYGYTWHQGHLWFGNGQFIVAYPYSQFAAGGTLTPVKFFEGSNASADPNDGWGVSGVGFDQAQNMWWLDYNSQSLRMLTAAQVAALTGVASNPVPNRIVSLTGVVEAATPLLHKDGIWFCESRPVGGRVSFVGWDKLSASGTASPDRYLETPDAWPSFNWSAESTLYA